MASLNVTRESVNAVAAVAKVKTANAVAWQRAIDKAVQQLGYGLWLWDGHTLKVRSATSAKVYTLDGSGCTCAAAQRGHACWHRAARRLIEQASTYSRTAV